MGVELHYFVVVVMMLMIREGGGVDTRHVGDDSASNNYGSVFVAVIW